MVALLPDVALGEERIPSRNNDVVWRELKHQVTHQQRRRMQKGRHTLMKRFASVGTVRILLPCNIQTVTVRSKDTGDSSGTDRKLQ